MHYYSVREPSWLYGLGWSDKESHLNISFFMFEEATAFSKPSAEIFLIAERVFCTNEVNTW